MFNKINQWFDEHDISEPFKQFIKNTGKQLMFYDLDYYVDDYTTRLDERVK